MRIGNTYSCTGGNQVGLVQDKYQMLMRGFFTQVFLHASTSGAKRVASIKYVDDNVRGTIEIDS